MERTTDGNERQYTLQELADSAGVSIRTIRYYIGEGLLPGPEGAGPQSHYTESHAQRLRAIGMLKERYLPLKEIRRELSGLDDAAIEALIHQMGGPDAGEIHELADRPMSTPPPVAPDGSQRRNLRISQPKPAYNALDYIDTVLSRRPSRGRAAREDTGNDHAKPRDDGERWRRIEVADGVELLVREEVYDRRKDRIDWLIDWARKVVD